MSDAAKRPDAPEPDDAFVSPPDDPPIPDGGLAGSMPDWLQRPPAWRGMTVREPERPDLPPPDTSVIDPRTMLSIDDLPAWLQRIAARAAESEGTTPDSFGRAEAPEKSAHGATPECRPAAEEQPPVSTPEQPPMIALQLPSTSREQADWWRTKAVPIGLAILVLLIVVWVVLVTA
jgi:hypothetical protein